MKRRLLPIGLSGIAVVFFAVMWWLLHDKNIAVLNPQGRIAEQQLELIIFTVLLGLTVIIPVFILLFYFIWKYRAANLNATYMPEQDGNKIIEGIWWGIPIIIIIVLSVVTWVTTHQLDPYRSLESDKKPLQVQVVALQWRWLFIYPEQQVASINELRIPAGRPIEFFIAADGPMSAFWIPNLGSQTYAMNGMTAKLHLEAEAPGTFRGSNTNISGEGYADMNFEVIASSEATFESWVSEEKTTQDVIDWKTYETLSRPTHNADVAYFRLAEQDLYQRVIDKYMGHGGH